MRRYLKVDEVEKIQLIYHDYVHLVIVLWEASPHSVLCLFNIYSGTDDAQLPGWTWNCAEEEKQKKKKRERGSGWGEGWGGHSES